jgi:hypothetical protein
MRKSIIPVAVVMLAVTNFPALASKYGCVFRQDDSTVQQCDIDTAASGSGSSCDANYKGGTIMGTCSVRSVGTNDQLKCFFHTPDKGTGAEKADVRLTAEPGFQAGGVTQGAPANLTAGYRENGVAPVLQVLCEPYRPK